MPVSRIEKCRYSFVARAQLSGSISTHDFALRR